MKEYKVIVGDDGSKCWYLNGDLHREDGPAVEYANGDKYWYLNGIEYSEKEFLRKTATTKELTMTELVKILGYNVKIVK